MRVLAAEGYVTATNQGTTVTDRQTNADRPPDHPPALSRAGSHNPTDERSHVLSAELVNAPEHTAVALGVEQGAMTVRRERINHQDGRPVSLSVSWLAGELAEQAPVLLSSDSLRHETAAVVQAITGREVVRGTCCECARTATPREAALLGLAAGDPVLAGQNTWYDQQGAVVEFGEYTIAGGIWITVTNHLRSTGPTQSAAP
jgi:DNA-binding GntR family transcriptional regulator